MTLLNSTVKIPIEICEDILIKRKYRAFQVFLLLKMNCSGKIKITPDIIKTLQKKLKLKSEKTIRTQIKYLLQRKWITLSNKSGYYFIKGFDKIRESEKFRRRACVEFDLSDLKDLKAFLVGAVITNLVMRQKRQRELTELKKWSSKTVNSKLPHYYPVASAVLAKIFKISLSTAWEWKNLARKKRYIKVHKQNEVLPIKIKEIGHFGKYADKELSKKCRMIKKKFVEQMPDLIKSNMVLRRRKKINLSRKK